ncbi:MAG TPA: 30S ribosomal protein S6 [Phycisphaerales bacterium]|nr:30S ribosomal protein S6 [Phycisphaerales bacterium]
METAVKRLYEGLFLVDSAIAAADWQLVTDTINRILAKAEAEVVSLHKWDERKLSYDIGKVSRGTYILVYFNCDPLRIHEIERDVQLSETLLRVMILRTDRMSQEDIEKPTPMMVAETQAQAAAEAQARAEADATDDDDDADDDFDDSDDRTDDD